MSTCKQCDFSFSVIHSSGKSRSHPCDSSWAICSTGHRFRFSQLGTHPCLTRGHPSSCPGPVSKRAPHFDSPLYFSSLHAGKRQLPAIKGVVSINGHYHKLCGSGNNHCLCGQVTCRASLRNKSAALFRVLRNSQCLSDLLSAGCRTHKTEEMRAAGTTQHALEPSLAGFGSNHHQRTAHLLSFQCQGKPYVVYESRAKGNETLASLALS